MSRTKATTTATKKTKKGDAVVAKAQNYKDPINLVFSAGVLYRCDSRCWWGRSSRLADNELTDIDPEVISGVKTLVDPHRLTSIRSYRSHGDRLIKKRGYSFIGLRGVQWIPKDAILNLEDELRKAQEDYLNEVEDFLANYESYKKEWKKKMKEHYDEALYPTVEQLRTRFRFEWQKFIIQVPDTAGILSEKEYKAEVDRHKARLTEWLNATVTQLTGRFYRILVNLQKRLDSGEKVAGQTLSSLRTFAETLGSMNVTKNGDIETMVNKALKFVGSSTAKDFNADDKLRKATAAKLTTVVDMFEKISKEDPRFDRAIEF